ncbi:substrate-binding periplasmic protein [Colwellia sp. 75C3]|uniref:substrate-binding periplasmic protein n=1 Tax=Colwellia sp. 75C3 TaxID=888425 RepID=UPI003FA4093F
MRQIKNGTIDFYPGLTFTPARAEFVLFIPNGLPSLDIGLTRIDVEEIKGPEDFAGKILLSTFGSTELIRHQHALVVKRPSELSHSIAINHILAGRADVYVDELSTIAYLLKDNLRKKELKYHLNCCGGLTDLTMGFSRKSIHYSEVENTLYNPEKPLSFDNYPMMLGSNSIAYRFYQSLLLLKANSYTDKLYLQYFGFDVHSIQTYNEDTEEKIKD